MTATAPLAFGNYTKAAFVATKMDNHETFSLRLDFFSAQIKSQQLMPCSPESILHFPAAVFFTVWRFVTHSNLNSLIPV